MSWQDDIQKFINSTQTPGENDIDWTSQGYKTIPKTKKQETMQEVYDRLSKNMEGAKNFADNMTYSNKPMYTREKQGLLGFLSGESPQSLSEKNAYENFNPFDPASKKPIAYQDPNYIRNMEFMDAMGVGVAATESVAFPWMMGNLMGVGEMAGNIWKPTGFKPAGPQQVAKINNYKGGKFFKGNVGNPDIPPEDLLRDIPKEENDFNNPSEKSDWIAMLERALGMKK